MRPVTLVAAVTVSLVAAAIAAFADPTVTIYTDACVYQSGDTIEVSLSAENDNAAMSVDVYVGIILPDGSIWSVQSDSWSHSIEPWIPDIYVPEWFEMDRTPFWRFDLPCVAPPIAQSGQYNFAAVLTYPGTFVYVSLASLAPFSYQVAGPPPDISMVSIPAGSYLMGSPTDEPGRYSDEGPQRTVNISAFMMSETEITEKQWEHLMGWNDCYYKRGDDYPVESVTWYDCVSFCNRLSEADGYSRCYTITNIGYSGNHITSAEVSCDFDAIGYRLPTEAEWEYACRAGTTTRFHSGDSDSDLDRAGWYYGNSDAQKRQVSEKEPNAWGLYDMHGNVWEWCWDWYSPGYYATRPDPDNDPTGPTNGSKHVERGGSWGNVTRHCRSAAHGSLGPDYRDSVVGFRVYRSPD